MSQTKADKRDLRQLGSLLRAYYGPGWRQVMKSKGISVWIKPLLAHALTLRINQPDWLRRSSEIRLRRNGSLCATGAKPSNLDRISRDSKSVAGHSSLVADYIAKGHQLTGQTVLLVGKARCGPSFPRPKGAKTTRRLSLNARRAAKKLARERKHSQDKERLHAILTTINHHANLEPWET